MRAVINLYLELAGGKGGVAHVPDIPGCLFRGADREALVGRASAEVGRYLDWCAAHGLGDLDSRVSAIVKARRKAVQASGPALVLRVAEEKEGAAIWESGAPAVLFDRDREPLEDASVHAHFRVVRAAYEEIARHLSPLDDADLELAPPDGSRSIAGTLDHIGHCLWWYCSRLSDELPEPGDECPKGGLARIQCLIPWAEGWLTAVPAERRADVVVPARFPSSDPAEEWTFAKVCRRQAEHIVEHIGALSARANELLDRDSVRSHRSADI